MLPLATGVGYAVIGSLVRTTPEVEEVELMEQSQGRKVRIDQAMFELAFDRDVDFHDACPLSTYLDLATGDVIWVYEDDEEAEMVVGVPTGENAANRNRVEETPNHPQFETACDLW